VATEIGADRIQCLILATASSTRLRLAECGGKQQSCASAAWIGYLRGSAN